MAATKPARPRAGLGLSSALGRDQMVTRKLASAHAKTAKPAAIASKPAIRAPKAKR